MGEWGELGSWPIRDLMPTCRNCGMEIKETDGLEVKSAQELLLFCCPSCLVSFYEKRAGMPTDEAGGKTLIERLETERKTRLITMIHRSEIRGKAEFITV